MRSLDAPAGAPPSLPARALAPVPRPADRGPARLLARLALATAIGSTGLAAGGTAGGIAATRMGGSSAWAGVPTGLVVAGSAVGAIAIARRAAAGRRPAGIASSYVTGAAGAAASAAAIAVGSLPLLLAASLPLGWGNAAVLFSRYEAAGAAPAHERGRALGLIFGATATGAVLSPNLLGPSGAVAEAAGLPAVAGLYLVTIPCFLLAAAMAAALGRAVAAEDRPAGGGAAGAGTWRAALGRRAVRDALGVLAASSAVMVGIMAVAPVWMAEHGHGLGLVGWAVGLHVLGMFGPSPLTGRLADRVGGRAVAAGGAALLVVAAAAGAAMAPVHGAHAAAFLVLLGLGWNAAVVGASALLVAGVPDGLRDRAEGVGEATMGVAAALSGPGAGLLAASGGLAAACGVAAVVAAAAVAAAAPGRGR
ncbi:MAG TPA: MFS transporter [Acidimicrobiales bacterium]